MVGGQALSSVPVHAASSAAPAVIQSLKNDVSAPLRTLQPSPIAPAGKGNQSHRPLHPGQSGAKLPTAGSIQISAGTAAMPSTSTNFEGINNIDGVLPPDTNGDVGPNNYVQWVNLHFQVFDKTGASLLGPSPGNALWSGFGGLCETTNQGDPVVRYDRMANRWVFTQFAFAVNHKHQPVAPFLQCFAVSTTGDPTGTYFRYSWNTGSINGTNYFPDYPKLAAWPDAYYMTVNYFSGNTFAGGGALAFDRSKMLNGLPATFIGYGPLGPAYGGSLPSDLDGSILPPSGSPNYFGAIDTNASPSGNTFQIWKFHVDFATPANSTFGLTSSHTPNFNLAVATYFWNMCNGSRNCIQQPGTSVGLDAIGDRLMNRLQYRRFADGHESLVANHTVGVGSGNNQAAVRWYEIRNLSTMPTIYQQSTYAPSGDSRWMGSIAMDQAGDIALGYSVSSSTVSPSIRYTGRLVSDPLASLPQGEATLIAGSGSQTSTFNRWGDYSMMAVDPSDDCTFWYTQEYYATTSAAGWQTRIGSFKFPSCHVPFAAAVAGGDRELFSLLSGAANFVPMGGALLGAPAIIALAQAGASLGFLYVATGGDHDLWVRSGASSWQRLTDSPVYCIDNPAGIAIAGTLYVACQGGDHALWHAEVALSAGSALPVIPAGAWHSLGGTLSAGPAIVSLSGTVTYFVLGADSQIYARTAASTGFTANGWFCVGHPAVASDGSTAYFACHGMDSTLQYSTRATGGWGPLQSLGGTLVDGPGIAATPTGPIFYVEGGDSALWHRSISGDWTKDGGSVQFGAAATSS